VFSRQWRGPFPEAPRVMALKCHLLTLAIETKVSQTMYSERGGFLKFVRF
jgi:hypothetical protein